MQPNNRVSVKITLSDVTILHMDVPLNEDATVVTGLEVIVKGSYIDLRLRGAGVTPIPADTAFEWCPPAPVIVSQKD